MKKNKFFLIAIIFCIIQSIVLVIAFGFKPDMLSKVKSDISSVPSGNPFTDVDLYKCVVDWYNSSTGKSVKYNHVFTSAELKKITGMHCQTTTKIKNIKGLDSLTNLTSLTIDSTTSVNFSTLKKMPQLYNLNIRTKSATNLDLSKNTNLLSFSMIETSGVESINFSKNQKLSSISIINCDTISKISNIPNRIDQLEIYGNKKLKLSSLNLSKMRRLKFIRFDGSYNSKKLPDTNFIVAKYNNYDLTDIRLMNCDQIYMNLEQTLLKDWGDDNIDQYYKSKVLKGKNIGSYSTSVTPKNTSSYTSKWQDGSTKAKKITCKIYAIRIRYHGNGGLYNSKDEWLDPRKFSLFMPNNYYDKPMIYTNDNFFVRKGYTFNGWKTKAGYAGWKPGYNIPEYEHFEDGEYGIGDETPYYLDLYAQWKANTYRIKYHGNGGTYKEKQTYLDPRTFTYNSVYKDSDTQPMIYTNKKFFTYKGHKFVGWSTKADGSQSLKWWPAGYSGNSTKKWKWVDGEYGIGNEKKGQLDLYAQWEPIHYTIKFNANGGTGTMADLPKTYGVKTKAPKNTFTREGYTFAGWNNAADGSGKLSYSDQQDIGTLTTVDGNEITFYAQWTKNEVIVDYNITYNLNGGTVSGTNPTTYNKNSSNITLINPTKEGYTFLGWTGSNGEEPEKTVTIESGSIGNRHYEAEYQIIKTDDLDVIDDSNIDIIDGKVFIEPETFNSLNKKELADSIPDSKVYDKNHNEITNDSTLIGTGYSLEYNGKEYPIIVYGDVNGDGKINMPDLTIIYRHVSSIATGSGGILNDIQKLASNINKDEKVDLSDMMSIYYIVIK